MLLSAVSFLIAAQSSSEIPEGLMNKPVYIYIYIYIIVFLKIYIKLKHIMLRVCYYVWSKMLLLVFTVAKARNKVRSNYFTDHSMFLHYFPIQIDV